MHKFTASMAFAGLFAVTSSALAAPANYPVFFQKWSAAIDANGATTIGIAARDALAHPTFPVIVTGSSDTVGAPGPTQNIALTRAKAVSRALVADGVPGSRIAVVSTGAISAPGVATGGYAQFSRRVLIKVGN